MADLVYLSITVVFFALCALYVRWCDRIIAAGQPGNEIPGDDMIPLTSDQDTAS